jgi:hypothetical protein
MLSKKVPAAFRAVPRWPDYWLKNAGRGIGWIFHPLQWNKSCHGQTRTSNARASGRKVSLVKSRILAVKPGQPLIQPYNAAVAVFQAVPRWLASSNSIAVS